MVSFKNIFWLLSNKRHHLPSKVWIPVYRLMRKKLYHLMVIIVMVKLLYYKEIPPIYWITLVHVHLFYFADPAFEDGEVSLTLVKA